MSYGSHGYRAGLRRLTPWSLVRYALVAALVVVAGAAAAVLAVARAGLRVLGVRTNRPARRPPPSDDSTWSPTYAAVENQPPTAERVDPATAWVDVGRSRDGFALQRNLATGEERVIDAKTKKVLHTGRDL